MDDEKKPSAIDDSTGDIIDAPLEEGATPEETTKVEDTVELTPEEKLFAEKGLDKQYPGGIQDLIERAPDTNKYLSDLEKERNHYRDQLKLQGQEPPAEAEFNYEDPKASIEAMIGKRDPVSQQEFEDFKVQNFIKSKGDDFSRLHPKMEQKLRELPGLAKLPPGEAVEVLFGIAKAEEMRQAIEKAQGDSPPPDKDLAETDVLGIAKDKTQKSPEDYARMSDEDMEKEFGVKEE